MKFEYKELNMFHNKRTFMGTQVTMKLPDDLIKHAKAYAKKYGFRSLEEFIQELLKKQLT